MKSHERSKARKRLKTLMVQTFRDVRSHIYKGSSLTELTVQQMRTLFLLLVQETTHMSDISNRLNISLPTVTNIISKLEEKGLVVREHDTNDRRVVLCSVSERGKAEIERLWSIRKDQIARIAESLSDEDIKLVTQAMEIILEAINLNQKDEENNNNESLYLSSINREPPQDNELD